MKILNSIVVVCLVINGWSAVNAQVKPSQVIPDFTFQTSKGEPFSKNNLVRNRKLVFILFDVTCSHCQHEMKALGNKYSQLKHVQFYLVSMDDWAGIRKFMSSYGKGLNGKHNVSVLRDYKPEFIAKFRPDKYPAIFIYSTSGHLLNYFSGENDINKIVEAVK